MDSILTISSIHKSFPDKGKNQKILNDISFTVKTGSIIGIIGKSGAGKSTLLRCLNGLEKPDQGHIFFQKNNLTLDNSSKIRELQQQIGMIFQGYHLLKRRNVYDNIALPLQLAGLSNKIIQEGVKKFAELVGLQDKLYTYPSQLSGGQCQRVAVARALVSNIKLLLCDEFTSALDPKTTLEILDLLKNLNQTLGITIILVTHDIKVVKEIVKYLYVLDQGKIVEQGPVTNVLPSPQHSTTQLLLAELFKDDLPRFIQEQLHPTYCEGDDIILKMVFDNRNSTKPLVSELIDTWKTPINIIAGNLEHIEHETFGHLTVAWPYHKEYTQQMIDFLQKHYVKVSIIGYLKWS